MTFDELIMLGGTWVSSIEGVFRNPDVVIHKRRSKESLTAARVLPLHPSCPEAAVKAIKHGRAVKKHEDHAVDVELQTRFKANPSSSCLYMSAAAAGVEKICLKDRLLATCLECAGPTNNGVPICHACQVFGSSDVNDYKSSRTFCRFVRCCQQGALMNEPAHCNFPESCMCVAVRLLGG